MHIRDWLLKGVNITAVLNYFERFGFIIIMISCASKTRSNAKLNFTVS